MANEDSISATAPSSTNPFLALFETTNDTFQSELESPPPPKPPSPDLRQKINDIISECFAITLSQFHVLGRPDLRLTWLEDFAEEIGVHQRTWLDIDLLERALFDRLLMSKHDLQKCFVTENTKGGTNDHEMALEVRCVCYLSEAFKKLTLKQRSLSYEESFLSDPLKKAKNIVVSNLATALIEPEIYDGQDLPKQFYDCTRVDFEQKYGYMQELLNNLTDSLPDDRKKFFLESLLAKFEMDLPRSFDNLYEWAGLADFLFFLLVNEDICEEFLLRDWPRTPAKCFSETVLGQLLTAHCLPRNSVGPFSFFHNPSKSPGSVHSKTEQDIFAMTKVLQENLFALVNSMLRRGPKVNHLALKWMSECLDKNADRGKLWNAQSPMTKQVPDGFMINLQGVLLRLCDPFVRGVRNSRLLKVDTRYSRVQCASDEERKMRNVHLVDFPKHNFILPLDEAEKLDVADDVSFNFVTDCFFITHKVIDLGMRVVVEGFMNLNKELNRMEGIFRDAHAQSPNSPQTEQIQAQMDNAMTRYLSIKAALMEPIALEHMMKFISSTSALTVHLAFSSDESNVKSLCTPQFPLNFEKDNENFHFVPELFFENICEFLLLVKRFNPGLFELNAEHLNVILDWILTFMASPKWVKNPHLRAKLAECLDCLLPIHQLQSGTNSMGGSFNREQLFLVHRNRNEIVPALLHVFVDIEATGHAVQFEYKFSYRKPMYDVMNYLWKIDAQKARFIDLAVLAEQHIDDEDAPLFLRFVNLLINDAIFLLDEALGFMKQIQEQQNERESWQSLPVERRSRNEAELNHLGRQARYHNIMGAETIGLLNLLTSSIKLVFTHNTMVDRIAAMLNYFLKSLVGPNRRNFKVKNVEQFDFKPSEIVTKICEIYINLIDCEAFVRAVSQDGRSYSQDLFEQAKEVLMKIGQYGIIEDLTRLAKMVQESSDNQREEDVLFADAPDHYLDPIMSVLMRDPVKLPSSGQIVDRQTIARHLLSDQNDPFNREPLTLDKVIPQADLKKEIKEWMEGKKKGKNE